MAARSSILAKSAKSHGQRGLVGYSPWGRRESDTTEHSTDTIQCIDLLRQVRLPGGQVVPVGPAQGAEHNEAAGVLSAQAGHQRPWDSPVPLVKGPSRLWSYLMCCMWLCLLTHPAHAHHPLPHYSAFILDGQRKTCLHFPLL